MEPIDLKSGKFEDVALRDIPKEQRRSEAFEKLNSLYLQYPIKPKKYGFTEQALEGAIPYDRPGFLKNWKLDKRTTNIPDYVKYIELGQ